MNNKPKRKSPNHKVLEELHSLLSKAHQILQTECHTDRYADYAMRIGGSGYLVSEALKLIEATKRGES